jgi:hypothetical protein
LVWPAARGRQELLRRPVVAELTGRRRSLRPGRHVAFRAGAKHRGQSRSNEQPRCSSGESARQRSHQPHTPCTPCSLCAPCHTTCTLCNSTRRQRPVTANLDQHCGLLAARCGKAGTRRRQKPPGGRLSGAYIGLLRSSVSAADFDYVTRCNFQPARLPEGGDPVCTRLGFPLARECAGTSKERKRTWR